MTAIKFDLASVTDAESGTQNQESIAGMIENLPFKQLPDDLRFSPMGGVPPVLRSGIIRVALAKLALTGVLAALVAIRATNADAAFSCALAAAVNFVACAHYYYILRVRSQDPPAAFLTIASGRTKTGEWAGRKETTNEDAKMFLQEFVVDGIRRVHALHPLFQ